MNARAMRNRINPPPCENPEWCPRCSFAIHCHERRAGFTQRVFWPGVALGLLVILALPTLLA